MQIAALFVLLTCLAPLPLAQAAAAEAAPASAAATPRAPNPPTGPITRGQRVFFTGHSFHFGFPPILAEMAAAGGFADHATVGVSSIGGSHVSQHVGNKDAQAALQAKAVDVLLTTPIYLPDAGIEQFARLGAADPNFRLAVMEFWLPYDNYEPRNYSHGPAGSPTAYVKPPKVDHDAATVAALRDMHARYFAEMDAQVQAVNQQLGRPVAVVVPCGQAVIALREKIIAGQAPGLKAQWDLFSDELGHPKAPLKVLMGWCHYAVIYRTSPVGLPAPKELGNDPSAADLNRLLQELAWDAVSHHPLSGVAAAAAAPAKR